MRLLMTGSAGFVGVGLCERLEKQKQHEVVGFDLKSDPRQDVTDYKTLLGAVKDAAPDWILHLAAQAFIPAGETDPERDARINILGTLNALRAAKELDCSIIYHSSGAVYGNQAHVPVNEELPVNPQSYYGASKACGELYAMHFARHRHHRVWVTRFSSVAVRGRREGPVYYLCKSALERGQITLTGDGSQSRDITHIDDVAQGVELILSGDVPPGQIYNLASGRETTMLELARRIFDLLGAPPDIRFSPPRPGDILRNYYDISRLRSYGYRPRRTLDDCVRLTLDDIKSSGGDKNP